MLVTVSDDPKKRKFAQMVAAEAGQEYASFRSLERLISAIQDDPSAMLFVDAPEEEAFAEFEAPLVSAINSERLIYLGAKRIGDQSYIVRSPFFGGHVTSDDVKLWNSSNAAVFARAVRVALGTTGKGIASFLEPDARIIETSLSSTLDKNETIKTVCETLARERHFSERLLANVCLASDELLMNAMYDAPVDELGNPLVGTVARHTFHSFVGKNRIQFLIGYDSRHCAIQVVDYHGSMDKQRLLSRIVKVYAPDEYQIDQRTPGAGLGLARIYRSEASLFFSCRSKVSTEATALLLLNSDFGRSRNRFQFLATRFE